MLHKWEKMSLWIPLRWYLQYQVKNPNQTKKKPKKLQTKPKHNLKINKSITVHKTEGDRANKFSHGNGPRNQWTNMHRICDCNSTVVSAAFTVPDQDLWSVLFWSSRYVILDDGDVKAKQWAACSLIKGIGQALSKQKAKLSLAPFLITSCMPWGTSEQNPPLQLVTVFSMGLQCQNKRSWITSDLYLVTCTPSCQLQLVSSSDKKSALMVLWWSRFTSFVAFRMQKLL